MWLWVSQTMSYRFPSKSRQSSRQGELRHKAQLAPVCSLCVLLYEMKIFSGSVLCTVMVTELTCEHLGGMQELSALPALVNWCCVSAPEGKQEIGPQGWRRKGCLSDVQSVVNQPNGEVRSVFVCSHRFFFSCSVNVPLISYPPSALWIRFHSALFCGVRVN